MKKNNFRPTQNNSGNFGSFGNFNNPNFGAQENFSPQNQGALEDEINKYSHMSEERLMQEMFALVDNGRKNGTLDNEKLEQFFNSASCMLNNEQITKLRYLVDMAKNS